MSNDLPVYRIREALERVLPNNLASRVLFDALGRVASVPQHEEEVSQFIRGPLAQVLSERELDAEPREIVLKVLQACRNAALPSAERTPSDQSTRAMPMVNHPVIVATVSAGRGFGERLDAALGASRVAPKHLPNLAEVIAFRRASDATLLVVDATDFPAIDPSDLASALGDFPASVPILIWAADLPYGRSLMRSLGKAGITGHPLSAAEGIEPLLDLIRSRRR